MTLKENNSTEGLTTPRFQIVQQVIYKLFKMEREEPTDYNLTASYDPNGRLETIHVGFIYNDPPQLITEPKGEAQPRSKKRAMVIKGTELPEDKA